MVYARAKDISPEVSLRAKKIAGEMRKRMERSFLLPPDKGNLAELRSMRKELEDMGFLVVANFELDFSSLKLRAVVTLYVLRDNPEKS